MFLLLRALTLALMLVSASCVKNVEEVYPVSYNVANNSDFRIKVVFNDLLDISGYMTFYTKVNDSIIVIEAGEQKTLFVALWSLYKGQDPEHDTVLRCMKTLRIYRNDSNRSATNFLLTRYWVFSKASNSKYDFNVSVATSDFNR